MKQVKEHINNNKEIIPLFIAFTALYFLLDNIIWLANFRFEDIFYPLIPEPHDWEVYAFIEQLDYWGKWLSRAVFLSATAGLGIWMIIGRTVADDKNSALIYIISLIAAVLCYAVIYFTNGIAALTGIIGAVLFTACAFGLFLWRLVKYIPAANAGLFVICAVILKNLMFDLLVLPYFWQRIPDGALTMLFFACAVAAAVAGGFYLPHKPVNEDSGQSDETNATQTGNDGLTGIAQLPRSFMLILFAVIFMSYVISNIAHDQVFAFLDAHIEIPYFGFILIVINYLFFIFAGYFFDTGMRTNGFLIGVMCVGINLAMALFLQDVQIIGAVWMSVFYNVLRDFCGVLLSVFTITAPIYFTARTGRGVPPQTGFFMFALCAFAVPVTLDATRPIFDVMVVFNEQFNPLLGIALLLTFGAVALIFALMKSEEKHERAVALDAVTTGKLFEVVDKYGTSVDTDDGNAGDTDEQYQPVVSSIRKKLIDNAVTPLTARELEVAELTVLGIKRKIIADTLFIQSSTVDTHRISIYNKFGVRTRDELLSVLSKSTSITAGQGAKKEA